MLLFLPGWLLLFLTGAAALSEDIQKHRDLKLFYWVFTLVFAVSVRLSLIHILPSHDHLLPFYCLKSCAACTAVATVYHKIWQICENLPIFVKIR